MVLFKQLATVLSQYGYKLDIFDEDQLENTSLHRLYKGIHTGEYVDDVAAARDIYHKGPTHPSYRKLKSILKRKLLNRLFFLHFEEKTDSQFQKNRYHILRQTFFMKVLSSFGALESASAIASQILHQAEKFHFTEATIDSLIILQQYASYTGQQSGFKKYTEQLHHYRAVYEAEISASEMIQHCLLQFGKSRSATPALALYVSTAATQILSLWEKFGTYTLAVHLFRIQMYNVQISGDYAQGLKICLVMETFFADNPHLTSPARFVEIAIYKNLSYLFLRQYEKALAELPVYLIYLYEGSNNWFIFMEDYFLILFHSGDITQARNVLNRVMQHRSFDSMNTYRRELWSIYEMYLLYCEGEISDSMLERISQLTVISHDKSAIYTAVLALQLLLMMKNKQYGSISDRDEYLKKYIARHLYKKNNSRSRAFFYSIRIAIKQQFNKQATLQAAQQDIALLYDENLLLDDFEVLPYEKIWQYIVDSLL